MEAVGAVRWPDLSQVAAMGMVPMEGWLAASPMGMPHGGVAGHAAHGHARRSAPSWAKGTVGGRSTCCDKLGAPKAERPTTAQETYHRLGKSSEEEAGPEEEDAFFNFGGLCFNADNKFFSVGKHRSSQLWHRGRHPCCQQRV